MRTWVLQDRAQSLVLASESDRFPQVVYWGPRIADRADDVARAALRDVTGGMLDAHPDLSICPEASASFPGQPGLILRDGQGCIVHPAFRFASAEQAPNALILHYGDARLGLRYRAEYALDAGTGMISARAILEADAPVALDWLAAPVFPASDAGDEIIDFAGRWCGEMAPVRTPWAPGIRLRESRTGRTGHEHLPLLYLPEAGATNTRGRVAAFHYGWSGGHRMLAEEMPDGRRQIQFGHAAGSETAPGTRFETAWLHACRSEAGLNGCAIAFQRHARDRIVPWPDSARPRPVHYNCWEAVYFDHSLARLSEIAARAAELGAERFVLDDGWFGRRDDDTSSLGDWQVDPRKWPDGLSALIETVHGLGMTFGLWVEPEMANPDSDLLRAHPDWALGPADQILGRQQKVLDMARPEVRDHLFETLSAILADHAIDYVKWDHNRVLPAPDAAQARGTWDLMDRLRAAHPRVEFESCASGGGRIDFGILSRTHRVWLSDSNDAHERLRIQHDAALMLPMAVTGSHVGPRRCHTSGRILDMEFRAWVASARHMGFEMDPRELTTEEASVLRRATTWWKENRGWMRDADILRLDSVDPACVAEQQIARGGARFVVFAGQAAMSGQGVPRPLRLTGLDPASVYRLRLVNAGDAHPGLSRGRPALKEGPIDLSGQILMAQGVTLPWSLPDRMWVIEGKRL